MLSFHSRKSSIIEIVLAQSHPQLLTHERWSLSRTKHLLSLDDKSTMNHIYNCIIALRFIIQVLHTIRKVKFLSKNSVLTKPLHFHEFFTQIFFDNFSREIKVVDSWNVQYHNIFTSFHPKKRQFSQEIKVEFLDKKWRFWTVWFYSLNLKLNEKPDIGHE